MATPGADQLALAHQREIATIAGGVTSVVVSVAMGADIASISTWHWGVIDGLLTRIQVGYAQSRNSAMSFLPRHARLSGAGPVEVVPGSLDVGRLRERLRITGPVMFKRSIAAGMDTDEAVEAMASRMAGVAEEAVRDGDRDVIEQTARRGKGVAGWRRRIGARACGFCAMLASRGAVYPSKEVALISHRGERYHPHCRCWAEPLYKREPDPPDVWELRSQWERVTAGHGGKDALRVWRRHWEAAHPRARQRMGLAAAEPSGGRATPGLPAQVRRILAAARSPQEVSRVLAEEYRRITGRALVVDLRGSVDTAREHAEGILRAVERNPEIVLGSVRTGPTASRSAYAETAGQDIIFNEAWSTVAARQRYLEALAEDARRGWHPSGTDSPVAVAVHEAGHVLDPRSLRRDLDELLDRAARQTGVARERVISAGVSGYAELGYDELVAEAYADVVMNGARASGLSRAIVRLVDAAPDRGRGGVMVAPLPSLPDLSRLPVTRLRAMVAEHGITVPPGLSKPALVRLATDLEAGMPPQAARARAVQSVLDERRVVADALVRAHELLGKGASERALRWLANSIRRGSVTINADAPEFAALLRQMKPLLDALDAADEAAARAALATVARSAKLRQVGGDVGDVLPFKAGEMSWIGQQRGTHAYVIRPGYATTYDGSTSVLIRAEVMPATPEQVAAVRAAAPAKKAANKAAPRKVAAPKAPPAPERMTAPALRKELEPATRLPGSRLTDADIAAVPKPVLAQWVRRWRELPEGERLAEVGRWSQVIIDRQRAVAEALAEASELLANEASAAALGSRAASRLRRIESLIEGWPHEAQIRALVTAMRTGRPAAIRRAMANAEKKLGLRRIGDEAGSATRFDPKVHRPIEGERIADGARVEVVRPGYEIEIGGERVVLMRPVVEVADAVPPPAKVAKKAAPAKKVTGRARPDYLDEENSLLLERYADSIGVDLRRHVDPARAHDARLGDPVDVQYPFGWQFARIIDGLRNGRVSQQQAVRELRQLSVIIRRQVDQQRALRAEHPDMLDNRNLAIIRDGEDAARVAERLAEALEDLKLPRRRRRPTLGETVAGDRATLEAIDESRFVVTPRPGERFITPKEGFLLHRGEPVPASFHHPSSGTAIFKREVSHLRPGLSDAENRALDLYTLSAVADPLNGALRAGRTTGFGRVDLTSIGEGVVDLDEVSALLDQAIAASVIPRDVTLWRGALMRPVDLRRLEPGAIITEPGYLSTATDSVPAERIIRWRQKKAPATHKPVLFQIFTPGGTHAALGHEGASEALLGRGRRMQVVRKSTRSDGTTVVVVMLLPE